MPAPTAGSSQSPVTPEPKDPKPSSGQCGHYICMCAHTQLRDTYNLKIFLKNTLFKGCQRCIPKKNASFTYHEVTKYSIQKIFLGHSKTKYNMDISLVQQDNPCICYIEISCKKQICLHMYFYRREIESKLSENL